MIWGIEGRHLWVPPAVSTGLTIPAGGLGGLNLQEYLLSLTPLLYWPLDIQTGATDISGNAHDGGALSGLVIGGAPPAVAFGRSSSTSFEGSVQRVGSSFAVFTGTRTFLGVVDRLSSDQILLKGSAGGGAFPSLEVNAATRDVTFRANVSGDVATWVDAWPATVSGKVVWALTYNNTTKQANLYINGVAQGTRTLVNGYSTPGNFEAGGGAGGSFRMNDLAIFNGALSADQITVASLLARSIPLKRTDDLGAEVFPRYWVDHIGGLQGGGESGDRRDNKVRAQGEIPRRSFRRGKTITYEGLTQAPTRAELRQAEADLSAAFDDQETEGLMVVTPHPLYDASGDYRYYPARALTCEIDDVLTFSPNRPNTRGHESPFVIALRNARAGGVSYFDQDGVGYP